MTFTVHRQKTQSPDIMGALTPMVFKEGFLITPLTECRGCPGTHTFKEGLSLSVHRGCPGTITFKEGLSRSVHRGCTDTHTFKVGLSFSVYCRWIHLFNFVFRHCTRQSSCTGIFFFFSTTRKGKKVYVCQCVYACVPARVCVCVCVCVCVSE